MSIMRRPKRWKNRPFNLDEGDINADWLKQNRKAQREDLEAHNTAARIEAQQERERNRKGEKDK